jgi:hypothetical protein
MISVERNALNSTLLQRFKIAAVKALEDSVEAFS